MHLTPSVVATLLVSTTLCGAINTMSRPFTAEDMLAAPRPQAAIANPNGTLALSVVDTWNPKEDKTSRSVYLLDLESTKSSPSKLFSVPKSEASDFLWLSTTTFAYLNDTTLYSASVASKQEDLSSSVLLEFPKGIQPTTLRYEPHSGTLAFSGMVWEDGEFENVAKLDEEYKKRGNTGQVYDELFVRHWDTWRTSGKVYTIGLTKLSKNLVATGDAEEFSVSSIKGQTFFNILNGTGIYSQMDSISELTLSTTHLAFSTKTPRINVATHTRQEVYLIPLPSTDAQFASIRPYQLTPGNQGAISSLSFSPDGKQLAWLQMAKDGYESDKRVIVVHELSTEQGKLGKTVRRLEKWDRSPDSIVWAINSKSLYFTAEDKGRTLPYHASENDSEPEALISEGSTSSITPLSPERVLISSSSLTSPIRDSILTFKKNKNDETKISSSVITDWAGDFINGRLDTFQGEEFWFEGAEGWKVMGWAVKPRGWKSGQKKEWPMAFLIHGGPQGAWTDSWSTRWNPAVFAAQGYFVIAVNPTGSTGYGQEFTDRMQNQWGGRPFKDLLAGYQHALREYPEIDPDRTAALGGSYGGYMVNWINGHNDQFGFKALVCHDGVFSTTETFFNTEEVWFPIQEYNGSPMSSRLEYEKWNPVNHVSEWTTPQLVIHSAKDFRLVNSQGIGAFTALQVQGVPSRFLHFPDENHWVLKPGNSLKWHFEVFRWLEEWVGDRDAVTKAAGSRAKQVAWSAPS